MVSFAISQTAFSFKEVIMLQWFGRTLRPSSDNVLYLQRYALFNLKYLLLPTPPAELFEVGKGHGGKFCNVFHKLRNFFYFNVLSYLKNQVQLKDSEVEFNKIIFMILKGFSPFSLKFCFTEPQENWTEETIKMCLYLYLGLLPVNHSLIHEYAIFFLTHGVPIGQNHDWYFLPNILIFCRLANVYTTATADIKRTILRVLETPVSVDFLGGRICLKSSFFTITINLWNSLPEIILGQRNGNAFTRIIVTCWKLSKRSRNPRYQNYTHTYRQK